MNEVGSTTPKVEDDALAQRTYEVRSALKELFSDLNSPLFSDDFHYDDIAQTEVVEYNADYSRDFHGLEYITHNSVATDGEKQNKSHEGGLNTSFMSVFSLDDLKDSLNQSSQQDVVDPQVSSLEGDVSYANPNASNDRRDLSSLQNLDEPYEDGVIPSAITPSANVMVSQRLLGEEVLRSPYQAQIELESMRSVAEQLTLEAQTYQKELVKLQSNIYTLRSEKAALQQTQLMILEEKKCVENENRTITSKCVELEKIANDATVECESLSKRLMQLESDLFHLVEERDEVLILHEQFEKSMKHKEVSMQQEVDELLEDSRRMERKLTKLKEEKTVLDNDIEILTKTNQSLKEEINSFKQHIEQLNLDKTELQRQHDDLVVKCSSLEETIESKNVEHLNVIQDRDRFHEINLELTKRISSLEESSSTFKEECGRLRNMNTLFKTKLENQEKEYGPKLKTMDSMRQQISSLSNHLEDARIEMVALSDKNSDLEMQLDSYKEENSRLKEKVASTSKEVADITESYEVLTKENQDLKDIVEGMKKELSVTSNLQDEIDAMTSSRNDLDAKVNALELELKSTKECLESVHRNPFTPSSTTQSFFEPPGSSTSSVAGIQTPAYLEYASRSTNIIEPGSAKSMDDRLERIKFASERALRTLQNITNVQNRINQEVKEARISKVDETEAFILDILNSCCQRKPMVK